MQPDVRLEVGRRGLSGGVELWAVMALTALQSQEKEPVPRSEIRNLNHRGAKGLMSHLGRALE